MFKIILKYYFCLTAIIVKQSEIHFIYPSPKPSGLIRLLLYFSSKHMILSMFLIDFHKIQMIRTAVTILSYFHELFVTGRCADCFFYYRRIR